MLPLLGVLALESVDTAVIVNILRYGLMTLGASLLAEEVKDKPKKVDVFEDNSQKTDVFGGGSQASSVGQENSQSSQANSVGQGNAQPSQSSQSAPSTGEASPSSNLSSAEGDTDSDVGFSDFSVPSVGGASLIEVLQSSGQATAQGFEGVVKSIQGLRTDLRGGVKELRGLRQEVKSLVDVLAKVQQQQGEQSPTAEDLLFREQLLKGIQSLGVILGGIGLSLAKLTEVFTTPVSVNPEEHITTATNPIEMLAKASGIQAKTFADINSFDAEADIPDLGDGIDISQIFKFLRVSSQIKG